MFFSFLDWGCGVWGRIQRGKVPFLSHQDTIYTESHPHEIPGDVCSAHLGKVVFAKFLLFKVTFFPFPILFFGSESQSIDHSQCGSVVELNFTS